MASEKYNCRVCGQYRPQFSDSALFRVITGLFKGTTDMNAPDPNAAIQEALKPLMPAIILIVIAGAIVMFLGLVTKERRKTNRSNRRNVTRSNKLSDKLFSALFGYLATLPWGVNVILAGVTFVILSFLSTPDVLPKPVSAFTRIFVYIAPIFLLFIAAISGINSLGKGRLLNRHKGPRFLRGMDWESFEHLIEAAYRQKGYNVTHTGDGPDGGIDLILEHSGKKFYVQCKHWKNYQVGVAIVRELYGVVAADKVDGGIVITSGYFTEDARDWAGRISIPIKLIEREELMQMLAEVEYQREIDAGTGMSAQGETNHNLHIAVSNPVKEPMCPVCGSQMVLRKAGKGSNVGEVFWGCRRFPKCKGTKPYVIGG